MASANSNAGSFGDNTEGGTSAAKDCPLHPGPKGACEKCMDDLKMDLATTKDLLTRATYNEGRKDMELMIARQKLSRFTKNADKTHKELDDQLAKIIAEATDARDEFGARLDDLTNEITQQITDLKLAFAERLSPIPLIPKREETASTSQAAGPSAKPTMCFHHRLFREDSDKCTNDRCSMRGQLAAPKRPHQEEEPLERPSKKTNADPQPQPTTSHSVVERDGDESWSTEEQPDGETGNNGDDDIVYLGEGQTTTK